MQFRLIGGLGLSAIEMHHLRQSNLALNCVPVFLCFDFELQLTPQAGNLGLMQSMCRIWVSAISGLEFGTQRPWRCHFKFFVFTVTDGSAKH